MWRPGIAFTVTALLLATEAQAQSTPTPTPTPTPLPRDPGDSGLPSNGPESAEFRRQTYHMRKPNQFEDHFQREWDSRVLMATNGGLNKYELAMLVAECVGVQDSGAGRYVGGMMSDDPDFKELQKALKRRYPGCVIREAVGIPVMMINGALGEYLVEKAKVSAPDKTMPKDIVAAQAFYLRKEGMTLETLGRCEAVFAPGLIMKAMVTKPGSDAEKTALQSVYEKTPECGVTAMPTNLSLDDQRAAMAAGLFHWLRPAGTRQTGGQGYDPANLSSQNTGCQPGWERQCVNGRNQPGDIGRQMSSPH